MKYTVTWRRLSEPEDTQVCEHLTQTQMLRRVRAAIRNSGPIIIDSMVIER